ncbi:MAG: DNA (cytosine-5-)-methyltransferase [Bacteroidetes bacterium]|nr:DNA (cytosine-5-)-methyltransferase [Bacteroidota bacterium]
MKILDLFSGIGGFSLGLEKAGWQTVAFCEIDKHCQAILKKHWPEVVIFDDITKLSKSNLSSDIDVICGGFPCQDISVAGHQKGITGDRSNLWKEYKRLINEFKPKYAIIENVANLRNKGLVTVLQDLAEIGYDAEWHCIPASAVGAPHRRDRIWIIAYSRSYGCECGGNNRNGGYVQNNQERQFEEVQQERHERKYRTCEVRQTSSDTDCERCERGRELGEVSGLFAEKIGQAILRNSLSRDIWREEPVQRVVDGRLNPEFVEWMMGYNCGWTEGIPRNQRIKALGNSLVPVIPEMIAGALSNNFKFETLDF